MRKTLWVWLLAGMVLFVGSASLAATDTAKVTWPVVLDMSGVSWGVVVQFENTSPFPINGFLFDTYPMLSDRDRGWIAWLDVRVPDASGIPGPSILDFDFGEHWVSGVAVFTGGEGTYIRPGQAFYVYVGVGGIVPDGEKLLIAPLVPDSHVGDKGLMMIILDQ